MDEIVFKCRVSIVDSRLQVTAFLPTTKEKAEVLKTNKNLLLSAIKNRLPECINIQTFPIGKEVFNTLTLEIDVRYSTAGNIKTLAKAATEAIAKIDNAIGLYNMLQNIHDDLKPFRE